MEYKQFIDILRYSRTSSNDNLGSGETSTSSEDDGDSYRMFGTNSEENSNGSSVKKRKNRKKFRKHRHASSLKNVEEMIGNYPTMMVYLNILMYPKLKACQESNYLFFTML